MVAFTPTGIAAAGSFLSGASSFLGGFGIGGGEKRPRYQDSLNAQMWAQRNQVNTAMELSKKHGIHPLTMLGMPSAGSPSAYIEGSKGPDLNAMGQGIDRMANAGRSDTQRKLDELALEQATLSNDYLRVQIAGAQKAIAQTGATIPYGSKGLAGSVSPRLPLDRSDLVEVVKDQEITKNPNDTGRTAGQHAAYRDYDIGYGHTVTMPYNEEGWAEAIGELPLFYKYPKMAEVLMKRFHGEHIRNGLGKWADKREQKFKMGKYRQK